MVTRTLSAMFFSAVALTASSTVVVGAPCASFPYVLANGTTADAGQVMANFNCVALTSGSTLTGITLSGTTSLPGHTTLASDGSIFIGKTAANSDLLGFALSPDGTFSFTANMATGGYSIINSPNGPGVWTQFRNNGVVVGTIAIGASSTAFNTTSDMRLKSALSVQKDYRSALKELWVGDFEWNQTHVHGFGILAQQAYAVFPEAITPPRNSTEFWQADYGKLAPLAIWGVKDLYKVTDTQANEIAALRTQVAALESQVLKMQQVSNDQASQSMRLRVRSAQSLRRSAIIAASN